MWIGKIGLDVFGLFGIIELIDFDMDGIVIFFGEDYGVVVLYIGIYIGK